MTTQRRLIDIVKGVVRRARLPRFFNRKGRRWHPTWQQYLCHLVYTGHAPSWPRAARFMRDFYGVQMDWTCWRKALLKWPAWAWAAVARASAGDAACRVAAIDGTTLARSHPSQHYYTHILGGRTARPLQQVVMIDVTRRKFLAWRLRARPRGETRDVPYLWRHAPVKPEGVLMDKGYDAEWVHEWLDAHGAWSVAPTRRRCRRGRHRKVLRDCFDYGLYWQRNLVESLIGAVKRLYGGHVRGRTWRAQRAEVYSKLIAYNLGVLTWRVFA